MNDTLQQEQVNIIAEDTVDFIKNFSKFSKNFLATIINSIKTYHRLYSYQSTASIVFKLYDSYSLLQKELLKSETPPYLTLPTENASVTIYSCSLQVDLVKTFNQSSCLITGYTFPSYEKIEIEYKSSIQ